MTILLIHSLYSVARLMAGAALSLLVGTSIGIVLGYFSLPRRIISPIIYLLAPVPKIALLPLVMLLFGIGERSKIFIIFLVMVFQVILAICGAVLRIPPEYYLPLKAVKAGHWFLIRHVVLPACLPELFTAVRIGLATGISVLFFAETFGTRWGLGFYIMDMWMRLNYSRMAAGIGVLALIGLASTILVDVLEKKICGWRGE